MFFNKPSSKNFLILASPKFLISMASLLTKCAMRSTICALQSILTHLQTASVLSLTKAVAQTGQWVGNTIFFSIPVLRLAMEWTICGMTSPARSIITVSPKSKSFSMIYSWLWMEILETVTPPIATGFNLATGVTAPVLPTWNSTCSKTVVACLALNLNAIAHLGWCDVMPNFSCKAKSLTLITKPSIS